MNAIEHNRANKNGTEHSQNGIACYKCQYERQSNRNHRKKCTCHRITLNIFPKVGLDFERPGQREFNFLFGRALWKTPDSNILYYITYSAHLKVEMK